jgi:hypothetical protein
MKKRKQPGSQLLPLKLKVQPVFISMAVALAMSSSVYAAIVTNANDAGAGGEINFSGLSGTQTITLTTGPATLGGGSPNLVFGNAHSITISDVLSSLGSGSLTKSGTGVLILNGANIVRERPAGRPIRFAYPYPHREHIRLPIKVMRSGRRNITTAFDVAQ